MSHLKDQMRKHAGLDLENPLGQGMLKFHFVTISWTDRARKLQKLENLKNRSIEELLGEAQKVYVRIKEEKQKAKIMLLMIKQVNRGRSNQYPVRQQVNRERPNQYPIGPQLAQSPSMGYKRPESQKMKQRRENKCFKCGETGHFKRECPEWEREYRETVPLMTFDEE
jgi:hypothetical protein